MDIIAVEGEDELHIRRLLYLFGFLLIASITAARMNCKSTLPSVRTLLTFSSTACLILRYSSLYIDGKHTTDENWKENFSNMIFDYNSSG